MTALRIALAFNGPMTAYHAEPAIVRRIPGLLKNMALFLASPFIGLAYALLLPFVGFGMLLWVATEGMRKSAPAVAAVGEPASATEVPAEALVAPAARVEEEPQAGGLQAAVMLTLKLLAAPFAGLAFVIALPFVALGALAWAGMKLAIQHLA